MFCRFGFSVNESHTMPSRRSLSSRRVASARASRRGCGSRRPRAPSRGAASPRPGSCASRRRARAPCARDHGPCRTRSAGTSCRGPSGRCGEAPRLPLVACAAAGESSVERQAASKPRAVGCSGPPRGSHAGYRTSRARGAEDQRVAVALRTARACTPAAPARTQTARPPRIPQLMPRAPQSTCGATRSARACRTSRGRPRSGEPGRPQRAGGPRWRWPRRRRRRSSAPCARRSACRSGTSRCSASPARSGRAARPRRSGAPARRRAHFGCEAPAQRRPPEAGCSVQRPSSVAQSRRRSPPRARRS